MAALPSRQPDGQGSNPCRTGHWHSPTPVITARPNRLTSARGTVFVAMLSRPQSAPSSKAEIEPTSRSMGTPPSPLSTPLLHQRQCKAVIALEADGLERGRVELRMVVK